MGSDSDLGTYSNRAAQTAWMEKQMEHTYYGGEFSGNLDWAKKYDTYLPENAIPEMYRTHLSYINSNIYQLYKDYTFGAEYDVTDCFSVYSGSSRLSVCNSGFQTIETGHGWRYTAMPTFH